MAESCPFAISSAAEQGARPQVWQLGQRRQRAVHGLLRERAQGQGRQDDQPQRPRREPGGLLLRRRALAQPLRRREATDDDDDDLFSAAAPRGAEKRRPTHERQRRRRRVQRRAVARAPVQLLVGQGRRFLRGRRRRLRPRRQLCRPVTRQRDGKQAPMS
jgi:hypothetical protein